MLPDVKNQTDTRHTSIICFSDVLKNTAGRISDPPKSAFLESEEHSYI